MADDMTSSDTPKERLLLYAPQREFVTPYIERALPDMRVLPIDVATPPATAGGCDFAVMLSGTEIYDADEGDDLDETTPIRSSSSLAREEAAFLSLSKAAGLRHIVLRCANTVGTGMTMYMRSLAESIYRATFFHFAGNEARLSVIHTADIAAVVKVLADDTRAAADDAILNIAGCNPTLHDLADALAWRMNQKHISTLSTAGQKWLGRLLYGRRKYRRYTTTLTFSDRRLRELTGTPAIDVVQYLHTHIYDEESL